MEDEFARVRALVFEPYTLFRVRPMSGRYVNVSDRGFRAGGRAAAWPPDPEALNAFVFGGSTAFGYGVSDAETIPSQLADRLAIPVYNFATPNHVSVQERIRLEQLLVEGHVPRIAIFIDGFDEVIAPYYAPAMFRPFVDALARKKFYQRTRASEGSLPDPTFVLDSYVRNTRLIRAVCDQFRVRPLFVWQPVPCYHYDGPAGDHGDAAPLIDRVRTTYEMMSTRRDSDMAGDDFLWLGDIQTGRRDNLYVDADHYTPAFSGEIASHIADHLIARGFLS